MKSQVTRHVAVWLPQVAVMTAVPPLTATTFPCWLTVAIDSLLEEKRYFLDCSLPARFWTVMP